MAKLTTFNGRDFTWKKNKGMSNLSLLGLREFPGSFYIRSHKTGESKLFLPNHEAAENLDGEAYEYFVPGGDLVVQIYLGNG